MPEIIDFKCPHCSAKLTALDNQVGIKFRCTKCGCRIQVPKVPPEERICLDVVVDATVGSAAYPRPRLLAAVLQFRLAGNTHIEILQQAVAQGIDPAMDRQGLSARPSIAHDSRFDGLRRVRKDSEAIRTQKKGTDPHQPTTLVESTGLFCGGSHQRQYCRPDRFRKCGPGIDNPRQIGVAG